MFLLLTHFLLQGIARGEDGLLEEDGHHGLLGPGVLEQQQPAPAVEDCAVTLRAELEAQLLPFPRDVQRAFLAGLGLGVGVGDGGDAL